MKGYHYQTRLPKNNYSKRDLETYAKELGRITKEMEKFGCPITYNTGLGEDGSITAGVDIYGKSLKDSVKDAGVEWKVKGTYRHKPDGKSTVQKTFEKYVYAANETEAKKKVNEYLKKFDYFDIKYSSVKQSYAPGKDSTKDASKMEESINACESYIRLIEKTCDDASNFLKQNNLDRASRLLSVAENAIDEIDKETANLKKIVKQPDNKIQVLYKKISSSKDKFDKVAKKFNEAQHDKLRNKSKNSAKDAAETNYKVFVNTNKGKFEYITKAPSEEIAKKKIGKYVAREILKTNEKEINNFKINATPLKKGEMDWSKFVYYFNN